VATVNEPTAAALAYGFGRGLNETVLVYDLGGGTFDVSVVRISDHRFDVLATGGDLMLGGTDFTQRCLEMMEGAASEKSKISLLTTPYARARTLQLAERAKIELSVLRETTITIDEPLATRSELKLEREALNRRTESLVNRSLDLTREVISNAGLTLNDINEVLLVGGQTRMPLIMDTITSRLGRPVRKGVHPEDCVALGAAILGTSMKQASSTTAASAPVRLIEEESSAARYPRVGVPPQATSGGISSWMKKLRQ
jgi:molecular chaperone DnaK